MGPSDDKVADVVHRMSVLGRAGDVKELKGAYLVSAPTALLGSPVIKLGKLLTRVRCLLLPLSTSLQTPAPTRPVRRCLSMVSSSSRVDGEFRDADVLALLNQVDTHCLEWILGGNRTFHCTYG